MWVGCAICNAVWRVSAAVADETKLTKQKADGGKAKRGVRHPFIHPLNPLRCLATFVSPRSLTLYRFPTGLRGSDSGFVRDEGSLIPRLPEGSERFHPLHIALSELLGLRADENTPPGTAPVSSAVTTAGSY